MFRILFGKDDILENGREPFILYVPKKHLNFSRTTYIFEKMWFVQIIGHRQTRREKIVVTRFIDNCYWFIKIRY